MSEALKKLRIAAGYTRQVDLADALGVDRTTVVKWETEREIIPHGTMLKKLATALNCSIDDLLADPDPEETGKEEELS